MKRLAIGNWLALLGVLLCCCVSCMVVPVGARFDLEREMAGASLGVLKVYRDTCPHCQAVKAPYIEASKEPALQEKVRFMEADCTAPGYESLGLDVPGVPAFFFVGKAGGRISFAPFDMTERTARGIVAGVRERLAALGL